MKLPKKCPHIQKCDQLIDSERFLLCEGELEDWDFDDCLKYRDNESETARKNPNIPRKFPREWDKTP